MSEEKKNRDKMVLLVKRGTTFHISIPVNPSTGYVCALVKIPPIVWLLDDIYHPSLPPVPGRGGSQNFTFWAAEVGKGNIEYVIVRLWEEKPDPMPIHKIVEIEVYP